MDRFRARICRAESQHRRRRLLPRAVRRRASFKRLRKAAPMMADGRSAESALNDAWAMAQADRVAGRAIPRSRRLVWRGDDSFRSLSTDHRIAARRIDRLLQRGNQSEAASHLGAQPSAPAPRRGSAGMRSQARSRSKRSAPPRLMRTLGILGERNVIQAAQERFHAVVARRRKLAGDLRDTVFGCWSASPPLQRSLERCTSRQGNGFRGRKTRPLRRHGGGAEPRTRADTLALSLTDELPPQQAAMLLPAHGRGERASGGGLGIRPEEHAALLAKALCMARRANMCRPCLRPFPTRPARTNWKRCDESEPAAERAAAGRRRLRIYIRFRGGLENARGAATWKRGAKLEGVL